MFLAEVLHTLHPGAVILIIIMHHVCACLEDTLRTTMIAMAVLKLPGTVQEVPFACGSACHSIKPGAQQEPCIYMHVGMTWHAMSKPNESNESNCGE